MSLRPILLGIAVLIMALSISRCASAGPSCGNLSASKLRVIPERASGIEEYVVSRNQMDRLAIKLGISKAERQVHPLMLMAVDIDAHVAVQHEPTEVRNDNRPIYCETPISVVVAFGVVKRRVYLLRQAATDHCIKHALLDHYAQHSQALDREVALFVQKKRKEIDTQLRELKQRTTADQAPAQQTFKAGLWSIIRNVVEEFKQDMSNERPRISREVDSTKRLNELRNACGGGVREMEQILYNPGSSEKRS